MSTGRPRLTGDARAKLVQKTAGLVEEAGSSGGALGADPAGPCAGRVRSARVVEGDVPYANARAESLKEAAPVAVAPKRRNGGKKKKKKGWGKNDERETTVTTPGQVRTTRGKGRVLASSNGGNKAGVGPEAGA